MMKRNFTFLLLCSYFMCHNQISAQSVQSISQGFSAHVHGQYALWNSNSYYFSDHIKESSSGIGFGAELRYGFSSMISSYLAFEAVNFDNNNGYERYNNKLYRFGGQYNFNGTTSKMRPYIQAGGVYQIFVLDYQASDPETGFEYDVGFTSRGLAIEIGAGLKYHILPELAAEFTISGQFGQYGSIYRNGVEVDIDEAVDTQHVFVRLGLGYFFY